MNILAALVWEPGGPFCTEEVALAPPGPEEALVQVAACGVCHTDEAARLGFMETPFPVVLGHEGAGVVLEAGAGLQSFRPGDRVGFSYAYCGACPACRAGKPYGCRHNRALNFQGLAHDGGHRLSKDGRPISTFFGQSAFATHAVVHQNSLYPVPEDLDLRLAGPLGCGIQTGAGAVMNYLRPVPGSSLVVAGCGVVGLSAVMAARLAGCAPIVCVDLHPARLALARELGATDVLDGGADTVEAVLPLTGGQGADYAIDCTGSGESVRRSLACVGTLGTCVVLGATGEVSFHCERELMGRGKTLVGLVEGCAQPQVFIPKLISLWRQGRFPFDRLLKFSPFGDIDRAFADSRSGKTVKPVLVMEAP